MPRVLITTDEIGGLGGLVPAYQRLGYEVAVGKANFFLHSAAFDVLHLAWPEEFSNWQVPSDETVRELERHLSEWKKTATLLFFVNNIYPHGYEGNPAFKKLYELFFGLAQVIVHYSDASRDLSMQEYPSAQGAVHCVTTMFGYHELVPKEGLRREDRKQDGKFRILIFGALRSQAELNLIKMGFQQAGIENKCLVMAGRYSERIGIWKLRWNRYKWSNWLRRIGADWRQGYIAENRLWELFQEADVVVIPRIRDLNSGVIGLAMTFGRTIVAPRAGSFPDQIEKPGNLLYEPGDAVSLARCLEHASRMDRSKVEERNFELAKSWTWDSILSKALSLVKANARSI